MSAGITKTYVGPIHLRRSGRWPATRMPLVMFHQAPSTSCMYEPLMHALSAWPGGEWTLIAPDTPGFGESAPTDKISIAAWSEALFIAITRMGIARFGVFGHHTGAAIAVQMAHDHPGTVAGAFLSGPPYLTDAQRAVLASGAPLERPDEEGRYLAVGWSMFRAKEPGVPLELSRRELALGMLAGDRYAEAYRAVAAHEFNSQLSQLNCPVMVTSGPHDSLRSCLEPAAAVLRDGRMQVIDGAGTYVCERQTDALAALVQAFFLSIGSE